MSTEHTLTQHDPFTLSATERSGNFALALDDKNDDELAYTDPVFTPAEMVAMAVKSLQVASYAMTSDAFDTAVREAIKDPNSYAASYVRAAGLAATPAGATPLVTPGFREELKALRDLADGGHIPGTMEGQKEFGARLDALLFSITASPVTHTGRFASNPPNMQSINPKTEMGQRVRDAFRRQVEGEPDGTGD